MSPRRGAGSCTLAAITLTVAAVLLLAACGNPAPAQAGFSPVAATEAPALPTAPAGTGIMLVHRGDDSGRTFLFTSYLNAQHPSGWSSSLIGTTVAWPRQPGELSAAGTGAVISGVSSAPGAIGYVGVSYLSQVRAAGEGEAALGNTAGTIQAALASFTNIPASETISLVNGSGARAYPIVNYEYAIVDTAQTSAVRARDLRAFPGWAITSGAAQLAKVNFQPLPSSVVTLSGTQIAQIEG